MDKARIFISYAREDESAVRRLYRKLSDAGFIPWMDKVDLLPGEQWRPAIEKALREADFLIICLSNTSVQKRGFVRREFRAALDLWQEKHDDDIYIIPVRLENCDPPDELDRFQWLDLFEDDEWPRLIRALQEGMRRRGKTARVRPIVEPAPPQLPPKQEHPASIAGTPSIADKSPDSPSSSASQSQPESQMAPFDDSSKVVKLIEAGGAQQPKEYRSAVAHTEPKERIKRSITRVLAPPKAKLVGLGLALSAIALLTWLLWNFPNSTNDKSDRQTPSPSSPVDAPTVSPARDVSMPAFSFETVTLDGNGRETSRKTGQAHYFIVELGNGVTLEMVEIPGGSFMMGSPATEADRNSDEGPRHRVNVPSFWMGRFEITQKQWMAVTGRFPTDPGFRGDELPVDRVSWNDAQEFLTAFNRKLGLQNKGMQHQYRLPSEAEWEYAARAGTDTPFAFGETITPKIVNYDGNYPYASAPKGIYRQKTVPVGSLGVANAFGLFDMHGNVWEWCEDVYHKDYNGAPTDGSAWLSGGDSSSRALRGGSWYNGGRHCRSAPRHRHAPGVCKSIIGFRVVVSARTL